MIRPFKNMYSTALKMEYTLYTDNHDIYFSDGTYYAEAESLRLKGRSAEDLNDIHTVKQVFNGEILPPGDYLKGAELCERKKPPGA